MVPRTTLLAALILVLLPALRAQSTLNWTPGGVVNIGRPTFEATTVAQLPTPGTGHRLIAITDGLSKTDCTVGGGTDTVLCIETSAGWSAASGSSGAMWGAITSTLSSQTDLQSALDGKSASGHTHAGTYEPAFASGLAGQYFRGDKTWQTLDKSAVGLGSVDNTSDASKPVSTATQTALDGKQPSLGFTPENAANKAAAGGYASLDSSSLVVQNPASATATPAGSKMPISGAGGTLAAGWLPLPSASTLGGVKSLTCTGTDKLSAIGTDGLPVCSADQGGAATWGAITGTLSAQADLQTALDGKSPLAGSANITTLGTIATGTVPWARLSDVPSTFSPASHGSTAHDSTVAKTDTPGTTGTAPNWASSVLNIPMASTASVTAGLLNKTDYDAFAAKPSLVASGTTGVAAFNAGTAATASRSDHTHRAFASLSWFFPGVVVSGTQTARALVPEGVTNCTITNSRITVNTTSGSSSTYNIARCTTSAGNCTATNNIYASAVTLNASTESVAGGVPNTATITAGDAFKVALTPGSALADVTVTMAYKCENIN